MENQKLSFKHICKEDTYMFNYTQLPDELFTVDFFKSLSLHAKVLYSFMLRRISLSKENSWIDDVGDVYIFYKVDEIMEKFDCSNKTASKIMAELEEIGLIEKKRQGQGKPDIIYVNKFSAVLEESEEPDQESEPELPIEKLEHLYASDNSESVSNSEVKNLHVKTCKNYTSGSEKNTFLEVKKVHANYKDNNYKELSNSSSTHRRIFKQQETVRLTEEEIEKIKKKIQYQNVERKYSSQIAEVALIELLKRDEEYRNQFTSDQFLKVCKTIASSKEPIVYLTGFINWCYDNMSFLPTAKNTNSWMQFMQRRDYDFEALEKEFEEMQIRYLEL